MLSAIQFSRDWPGLCAVPVFEPLVMITWLSHTSLCCQHVAEMTWSLIRKVPPWPLRWGKNNCEKFGPSTRSWTQRIVSHLDPGKTWGSTYACILLTEHQWTSYWYSNIFTCTILYIHELIIHTITLDGVPQIQEDSQWPKDPGARKVGLSNRIDHEMHYVVSGRFMLVCRCLHRLRNVKCRLKIARPPILTWTQSHRMLLSISSRPTPPQNCTKRRSSSRLRHPCISCWWQARGEKAWRNWETMKTQWRGWRRGGGCCFEHLCTVTAVL